MDYTLITALAGFAFVSSITPGPNNLMLMASGANFGFLRSLPHMAGVGFGFLLMIVLVGLGLAQVFELYPLSHTILKIASVLYLLYLAWKIANAAPKGTTEDAGRPMTFFTGLRLSVGQSKGLDDGGNSRDSLHSGHQFCRPVAGDSRVWRLQYSVHNHLDTAGPANGACSDKSCTAAGLQPDDGGPADRVALYCALSITPAIRVVVRRDVALAPVARHISVNDAARPKGILQ